MDHTIAGLREQRRNRETGTTVSLYNAREAGLDPDGGDWVTVCEDHGNLVNHQTRKMGSYQMADPAGWCYACQVDQGLQPIHDDTGLWSA